MELQPIKSGKLTLNCVNCLLYVWECCIAYFFYGPYELLKNEFLHYDLLLHHVVKETNDEPSCFMFLLRWAIFDLDYIYFSLTSEPKINGTTAKRIFLTEHMIKGMDHVYRSNPYPSKLEFETLCKDFLMSVGQAKVM